MRIKQVIMKNIVAGFIFLMLIGVLFTSNVSSVEIDEGDGIWSDDFKTEGSVTCINCRVDYQNGIILLNETSHAGRIYDFNEGGSHIEGGEHEAYYYQTFLPLRILLFDPSTHIRWETEFDKRFDYPNLEDFNETDEDERYIEASSAGFKKFVVHHFRFKLDVDSESVGNLNINWSGRAEDDSEISLYYWKFFSESKSFGLWAPLNSEQSDGDYIEFSESIVGEDAPLALNEDNYIDICVVGTPSSSSCTLYTDYIKIISDSEIGYVTDPASVVINDPIEPNDEDFYWSILTWDDSERAGAEVKYHVLCDKDGSGNYSDFVEDKYFSDGSNEEGFTNSPVVLTGIPYDKIKLMANLTTDSPAISPKIFSLGVTWQNDPNKWQDLFNSSLRIDIKNRINHENSNISINPVSGDWPMFGQNLQNTRASDGKGGNINSLYWWGNYHEDEDLRHEFQNPIISDEYFYISANNYGSGKIYRYNIIPALSSFESGDKYPYEPDIIDINSNADIRGSPVITDQYIIVATGETGTEGSENYVYAIDKEDFSSVWEFPYDDNICYWASPVVAEDKVFIASWSGDRDRDQSNDNNKLIALELSNGNMIWEFTLPSHGFSTPAIYKDMIIVGCKEGAGNSIFALDMSSGDTIWNQSVGSIGMTSPVIYDDKVFIVSEVKGKIKLTSETKVTALDAKNGSITWEKIISRPILIKIDFSDPHISKTMADSTPAVYDDVLYVASPLGDIIALDTTNGTELWSTNVYTKPIWEPDQELPILSNDLLVFSPAYADEIIYIGTPDGNLYALNALDGTNKWSPMKTYKSIPVATSPIVSNGLVFIGTALEKNSDNEPIKGSSRIYCMGSPQEPGEKIDGYLTSIPINLPQGYWWKKFYANYNDSIIGNNIKFSILDEDKSLISEVENDGSINFGNKSVARTVRLRADLYADNLSVNPILSDWSITFEPDNILPIIDMNTFYPNQDGWLTENVVSEFIVNVKDNETGLNVDTAKFELAYTTENGSGTKIYDANCTGEVGTTSIETITIDITALEEYENITKLDSIEIFISDLAGNENSTGTIVFKQDVLKPESSIDNETDGKKFSSDIVKINATAFDPGIVEVNSSGIAFVQLIYRHSSSKEPNFSGDWEIFGQLNSTSPSWNFTAVEGSGHYELATIATDNVGNAEDEPESGDVSFILDNEPPNIPDELSEDHWFKELPVISIEFSDGFLLDTIKYKPEFETEWTIIESDINHATYDSEWFLDENYWDQMDDGEQYQLFFWISDSLGNIQIIEEDGYILMKDAAKPNVDLEIPTLETEWSFDDTFMIKAFATDGDGSGIKSVELFYQYSEDGKFDGNWTSYGVLTFEPFEWEFEAGEGNGYYEFKVVVEDLAGNVAESEVLSTGLNMFPLYSVIAMVILISALILISIAVIIKWRKK